MLFLIPFFWVFSLFSLFLFFLTNFTIVSKIEKKKVYLLRTLTTVFLFSFHVICKVYMYVCMYVCCKEKYKFLIHSSIYIYRFSTDSWWKCTKWFGSLYQPPIPKCTGRGEFSLSLTHTLPYSILYTIYSIYMYYFHFILSLPSS